LTGRVVVLPAFWRFHQADLTAQLEAYERSSSNQIVVATVQTSAGWTSPTMVTSWGGNGAWRQRRQRSSSDRCGCDAKSASRWVMVLKEI
jgi:hypothetical protein